MIKLKNVSKLVHNNEILSNITLQVEDKDRIGIVGLHGSGKTILMEILAGEIKPSSGEVYFDVDKRKIAYIPQVPKFPPYLKVKEILNLTSLEHFETIDLEKDKKVKDLSLEEKKKLSFYLYLPYSPKCLLIDDFTPGLKEIVKNFNGCVVISHHNLRDIWEFINDVIILFKGKIVFYDKKEKLLYKVVLYRSNEGIKEIWQREEEEENIEKDKIVEIRKVTPDEVFLHFYSRT
ncbi:hypothetical protein SJAV_00470 [Sulfurisphaera javensis]|uniref:ABC transporter domain-containing protein n=1 Tax=Sulfurisphaera javensis TaxID=2049879 RepID=A0AAT9GN14_9CREN